MKNTLLATLIICALTAQGYSQSFSGNYTFDATTNSFAYNGPSLANLSIGNMVMGPGIGATGSAGNLRATNWTTAGSLDLNDYLGFTVTAQNGYSFSMSDFNFGIGRNTNGTRNFSWYWSTNNFTSSEVLSDYTALSTTAGGITNTAGVLSFADVNTNWTGNVLDLSALTGLSSIQFRLYGWSADLGAGTAGLGGPFTFSGSLAAPALTTNTWSGGSGSWETGQQDKFSGAYTNGANSSTVFSGSLGVVTVVGGVEAAALTFSSDGFAIAGAVVTNTLGNIATDAGITTFSSDLAGSAGLTKTGIGTLTLSGAKTFSGNVAITAGTLQIESDASLGNAANDIFMGGTLRTTNSISLGVGRSISGSGTFDIANGTTLTVNGSMSNVANTTLANTGTLDLQGATRSLGSITLNAAATINAIGAINATGLTAPGVSSGTATINPDIVFTSGDKLLNVASGGTVDLNGALSNGGGTGRIIKTGAGTLILSANNMGGVRIGTNAATSVDGGTVILNTSTVGTQAQAIQLNNGTLSAASNLVFTTGISIGGQTNGVAILSGNNMEFQGQSAFFRNTGTTGPAVLDVNNTTTFSGGFNFVTGAGTGTGVTIGGSGTVIMISNALANSSALVDTITLTDTVKLTLNDTIGGNLTVGPANTLGGNGTIGGSLSLLSGAKMVFSLTETLIVQGPSVTFGGFSIGDLIGLDNTVPNGVYEIIGGLATINTNNLINFGAGNAYDLGGGKSAYFTVGSLEVNVVPEPSTYALLGLAAAGLGAHLLRRRRR